MDREYRRRTVVRTAGIALAGAVAGCGGDQGEDGTDETTESTPSETTTAGTEERPSVDQFLSETSNYDGIVDRTGTDAVDVDVGVEANGAFYGFGPPAVRIDQGATVTWTWTGRGSVHNVATRYGADFESEQTSEAGFTFEHTFEDAGTVLYVCVPHEGTGMKGAVVVE